MHSFIFEKKARRVMQLAVLEECHTVVNVKKKPKTAKILLQPGTLSLYAIQTGKGIQGVG